MNYVGISTGFHDAAISVVDNQGNISFAGHSERYSKIKHDKNLCAGIIQDALEHCGNNFELHYYEKPWLKTLRQIRSGEQFQFSNMFAKSYLGEDNHQLLNNKTIHTHGHHLSHAAAGFQTSPFSHATIVVIDAIGEFDTITIWNAYYNRSGYATYEKLYTLKYPDSIGLFYSAMTERVGLRPLDEEYILMGMAAYGTPKHYDEINSLLLHDGEYVSFKENLHAGVDKSFLADANEMDIASSAQYMVEDLIQRVLKTAKIKGSSNNLVYCGGVALNCLANRLLGEYFKNIWIMPNPGDAGSSLGAACLGYGKKVNWTNAYLGHSIPGAYPVDAIIAGLVKDKIVGVASGRAEFGPRALGNRSLLADPRGPEIKDAVNEIKRRQKFRPFAPVILEEYVHMYFDMPENWNTSPYMQTIGVCRKSEFYPAIVHADGTSRVQTVPSDGTGIRQLLEKWYALTGCPMLLNTSLNIRGEPMVNDRSDADRFQERYGVIVYS